MSLGVHISTYLFGLKIHLDTIIYSWIVMALILLGTFLMTRNLKVDGYSVRQTFVETIWGLINGLTDSQIPSGKGKHFNPLIGGIFLFTVFAYWVGLLPWKVGEAFSTWPLLDNGHHWEGSSPAGDINVTTAMALIALITYIGAGIRFGGKNYISLYFKPLGFVEWLDMVVRPLTLALRLFANTVAGEVLVFAVLGIVAIGIPMLAVGFELFVGIIQALVFSLLTTVYIGTAIAHGEHGEEH